jgi:hypothetical protein
MRYILFNQNQAKKTRQRESIESKERKKLRARAREVSFEETFNRRPLTRLSTFKILLYKNVPAVFASLIAVVLVAFS